jgi:hypothetical protein
VAALSITEVDNEHQDEGKRDGSGFLQSARAFASMAKIAIRNWTICKSNDSARDQAKLLKVSSKCEGFLATTNGSRLSIL